MAKSGQSPKTAVVRPEMTSFLGGGPLFYGLHVVPELDFPGGDGADIAGAKVVVGSSEHYAHMDAEALRAELARVHVQLSHARSERCNGCCKVAASTSKVTGKKAPQTSVSSPVGSPQSPTQSVSSLSKDLRDAAARVSWLTTAYARERQQRKSIADMLLSAEERIAAERAEWAQFMNSNSNLTGNGSIRVPQINSATKNFLPMPTSAPDGSILSDKGELSVNGEAHNSQQVAGAKESSLTTQLESSILIDYSLSPSRVTWGTISEQDAVSTTTTLSPTGSDGEDGRLVQVEASLAALQQRWSDQRAKAEDLIAAMSPISSGKRSSAVKRDVTVATLSVGDVEGTEEGVRTHGNPIGRISDNVANGGKNTKLFESQKNNDTKKRPDSSAFTYDGGMGSGSGSGSGSGPWWRASLDQSLDGAAGGLSALDILLTGAQELIASQGDFGDDTMIRDEDCLDEDQVLDHNDSDSDSGSGSGSECNASSDTGGDDAPERKCLSPFLDATDVTWPSKVEGVLTRENVSLSADIATLDEENQTMGYNVDQDCDVVLVERLRLELERERETRLQQVKQLTLDNATLQSRLSAITGTGATTTTTTSDAKHCLSRDDNIFRNSNMTAPTTTRASRPSGDHVPSATLSTILARVPNALKVLEDKSPVQAARLAALADSVQHEHMHSRRLQQDTKFDVGAHQNTKLGVNGRPPPTTTPVDPRDAVEWC